MNSASTFVMPALGDASMPEYVQDPHKDIARNFQSVTIRVDLPNRQKFQRIWVQTSDKGGFGNTLYKQEKDAPFGWVHSLLPTESEKAKIETLSEAMVVGFVLCDDTAKYTTEGAGQKNKENDDRLKVLRGLKRPERVMRAVIRTTEWLPSAAVYYVTVHNIHGVFRTRRIDAKYIFFYSEFWPVNIDSLNSKTVNGAFSKTCRTAASDNDQAEERVTISVVDPKSEKWQSAKAQQVSTVQNVASRLRLHTSIYVKNRNPASLTALENILNEAMPFLKTMPASGSDGVYAFFDEENEAFGESECEMMLAELASHYEKLPTFDVQLVLKVRKAHHSLGVHEKVPRSCLGAFLQMATEGLKSTDDDAVILNYVRIYAANIRIMMQWTFCRPANYVPDLNQGEFVEFTEDMIEALAGLRDFFQRYATSMVSQHGGIQKWDTINELITSIESTVDRDMLKARCEQLFAIHAEMLADANVKGAAYLDDLVTALKMVLGRPTA